MRQIGLTGGIGSGKSTVSQIFARHDAAVIDADIIARAVTAVGGSALPAIAKAFGPKVIDHLGALDRTVMRALVFDRPSYRKKLEAIVHPWVAKEIARQVRDAMTRDVCLIVLDIPLLAEGGPRWRSQLDRILVVDCDELTQIQRVQARNQLPIAQIERIIRAQSPRSQRLKVADMVVHNGTGITMACLQRQVQMLAHRFGLRCTTE